MTGGFRLGKILGFEISVDFSWFVIFFLVLWSFSMGLFPAAVPGHTTVAYLVAGVISALLLFASLLAHELSHSVVARAKGIPVEGITLFIFGGIARTRMEASSPGDEFQIAGVGPLSSFFIALGFGALWYLGARLGMPPITLVAAQYLGFLNLILAIFNLLPGFPLDGGRLFRAMLWKLTGDLTRATRIATTAGQWFGFALVALGLLRAFQGFVLGGLWLVFIGWFLRNAAAMSYRQHLVQSMLEGVTARQAMTPAPQTVPAHVSLAELMDEFFMRQRHLAYPVLDGDRPVGIITLRQVRDVPREDWNQRSASDVMEPADERLTVGLDDAMTHVIEKLQASPVRRVLVLDDGHLEGILTANDVAGWLDRARQLKE
jgi:Zn-dependent protease/CBS domain-containing protein